jgi:hypothetical protein
MITVLPFLVIYAGYPKIVAISLQSSVSLMVLMLYNFKKSASGRENIRNADGRT